MALNFTNTSDRQHSGITAFVYGPSGIGKTTLLGTIPGKTLIIDIEGGTSVLRERRIDTIQVPESLDNLKEVFDYLDQPDMPYDSVCLDSATELWLFMLIRLGIAGKNDGVPSQADYQRAQFKMREYIRILRDLRARNINIVVTALEMTVSVEQFEGFASSKIMPMMSAKIAPELCGLFDIVGHMEQSQKEGHLGERFLRLTTDGKMEAKDRVFGRTHCKADGAELFQIETGKE